MDILNGLFNLVGNKSAVRPYVQPGESAAGSSSGTSIVKFNDAQREFFVQKTELTKEGRALVFRTEKPITKAEPRNAYANGYIDAETLEIAGIEPPESTGSIVKDIEILSPLLGAISNQNADPLVTTAGPSVSITVPANRMVRHSILGPEVAEDQSPTVTNMKGLMVHFGAGAPSRSTNSDGSVTLTYTSQWTQLVALSAAVSQQAAATYKCRVRFETFARP